VRLFDRAWRVSVGTLEVSALDLSFEVARTLTSKPNTLELTIYNLSERQRTEIAAARGALVRLEAGYADGTTLLFVGTLREARSERVDTDWVTKVSGRDGGDRIQRARVLRSFAPDTTVEAVARALADSLGIGAGNAAEALRGAALDRVGRAFPEGTVLSGASAQQLTTLLRAAGFEWSVQDGVLQVLARGRALARSAVLLTPDTGLLDSPTVSKSGKVTARALLIPDLVPGRQVEIRSASVRGVYRIASAGYAGDTRGEDWHADLVCATEAST
jgi:hypothetical protein